MLNENHPDPPDFATSHHFRSADGLTLHYREYKPAGEPALTPVVCLPGLTRTASDFALLARALAGSRTAPRRVLAFDYRGRGLSDHAQDWRQYDLPTERSDLLIGLEHAGIPSAHFIGTSRGGLHVMALAPTHPELIRAVVLNDIGPVIEQDGLVRIKSYVGAAPDPGSIEEAVARLQRGAGAHFDLSEPEWRYFAMTTFGGEDGLKVRYDPDLARTLDALDLARGFPELWPQFDALAPAPLLAIRGDRSDLLSPSTFATMIARWPACQGWTVEGQGHAPLLADEPTVARIHAFFQDADAVPAH